jgi:7-carboxy-7-deazaguanine synthase
LVPIENIVDNALKTKARAVVVTGGEPSLYNLELLTSKLKENNIEIFLEIAGTNKLTGEWDWICLSPKKQSPPVKEIYNAADELKVIIFTDDDFEWAEEAAKHVSKRCKLYLQSEWSMYKKNIGKIVDYVKENPKWNISLQSHRFMNIP